MSEFMYRPLAPEDCVRIRDINASQFIGRAWRMVGFAAMNPEVFGAAYRYALLDQLFISLEHRRKGIGRELFLRTASAAKARNIEKLYICAGSSEETIAFYRALGCVDAMEINETLYSRDPRDLQLEFST